MQRSKNCMSWEPSILVVIFQGGDKINSSKPVNRVKHGKLTGPKACLWALSRASLGPWEEKPSYHSLKGNRGEKWERKRDNFQRCWVRNERRLDKNPCKEKPVKGDIVSDKAETKGREKLKSLGKDDVSYRRAPSFTQPGGNKRVMGKYIFRKMENQDLVTSIFSMNLRVRLN